MDNSTKLDDLTLRVEQLEGQLRIAHQVLALLIATSADAARRFKAVAALGDAGMRDTLQPYALSDAAIEGAVFLVGQVVHCIADMAPGGRTST
jgi:hypothetical protein